MRVLSAAVPCALLLSGCGVAETQFHPGVAVEVGDRTITTDRVDDLTSGFCAAVEDQIATEGQALPMHIFKRGIVGQLALQSAVEQMAQDFDVRPGTDYYSQVAQIESDAEGLSDERPGRLRRGPGDAALHHRRPDPDRSAAAGGRGRGRADRRLPAGPRAGRAGGLGGARRGHLRPALPDRAGRGPAAADRHRRVVRPGRRRQGRAVRRGTGPRATSPRCRCPPPAAEPRLR